MSEVSAPHITFLDSPASLVSDSTATPAVVIDLTTVSDRPLLVVVVDDGGRHRHTNTQLHHHYRTTTGGWRACYAGGVRGRCCQSKSRWGDEEHEGGIHPPLGGGNHHSVISHAISQQLDLVDDQLGSVGHVHPALGGGLNDRQSGSGKPGWQNSQQRPCFSSCVTGVEWCIPHGHAAGVPKRHSWWGIGTGDPVRGCMTMRENRLCTPALCIIYAFILLLLICSMLCSIIFNHIQLYSIILNYIHLDVNHISMCIS